MCSAPSVDAWVRPSARPSSHTSRGFSCWPGRHRRPSKQHCHRPNAHGLRGWRTGGSGAGAGCYARVPNVDTTLIVQLVSSRQQCIPHGSRHGGFPFDSDPRPLRIARPLWVDSGGSRLGGRRRSNRAAAWRWYQQRELDAAKQAQRQLDQVKGERHRPWFISFSADSFRPAASPRTAAAIAPPGPSAAALRAACDRLRGV